MKWSTEAKVGAFSLIGIIIFAAIIVELSNVVIFGKKGYHVTGYFQEAEGIEPGNPVHYAGVDVGKVDQVSIKNGEAALSLRLYNGTEIPRDAKFTIETSSVMGGRFVKVSGGSPSDGFLQDGMTIEGQATPGIDQAMNKLDKLMDSAQKMLDGVNSVVADQTTQKSIKNSITDFDAVSSNLAVLTSQSIDIANQIHTITSKINSDLDALNGDGKFTNDTRHILDNLSVASDNARVISENAVAVSGDARHITGKIDHIMNGKSDLNMQGSADLLYNTKNGNASPDVFFTFGKNTTGTFGVESIGNDPVYDAFYGRKHGPYGWHAGFIRNKLGGGLTWNKNRWRFDADVFNPNDWTFRVRGSYELGNRFSIIGQSVFPHNHRGGGEYFGVGYNY